MDNAYQQKLQERAWQLCRKRYGGIIGFLDKEKRLAAMEPFFPLAALTLEWSANNVTDCMKAAECSAFDPESCAEYLVNQGFIPPNTDNNEG